MALDLGTALLAGLSGAAEGAVKVQSARDKALADRISKVQDAELEVAKSKHKEAWKEWNTRNQAIKSIMAVQDPTLRQIQYAKEIAKIDPKVLGKMKFKGEFDVSNEALINMMGDEPIENYDALQKKYESVRAPHIIDDILGVFGGGRDVGTVEEQMTALRKAETADATGKDIARAVRVTAEGGREPAQTSPVDLVDRMRRYDLDTGETTFDNLLPSEAVKAVEAKVPEAAGMDWSVFSDATDGKEKEYQDLISIYKDPDGANMSDKDARKAALNQMEKTEIVKRRLDEEITVPYIMAIREGRTPDANLKNAFDALSAMRMAPMNQMMLQAGYGYVPPGAAPNQQVPPAQQQPTPTQAVPLEEAIKMLQNNPALKDYFIKTYGEENLPPELKD
jgi:hypothetical protein